MGWGGGWTDGLAGWVGWGLDRWTSRVGWGGGWTDGLAGWVGWGLDRWTSRVGGVGVGQMD